MFFVVFPFANSLLDWGSLTVTRRMMRWWVAVDGAAAATFARYGVGVLVDLVIAVVCVCALSALFSAGVAGLNAVVAWRVEGADPQVVDWMAQMRDFRDHPFGAGLMVTLMLFSTLLPTLVHLGAGTAALVRLPHLGRDAVLRALADGPPEAGERLRLGAVRTVQWLVPAVVWGVAGLMFLRFFVPLSWLHALGLPVPGDTGDVLLLWLPYKSAELVWTALGG